MTVRRLMIILGVVLLLSILAYYTGVWTALQRFNGHHSWQPMREYSLSGTQDKVLLRIENLVKENNNLHWAEDTSQGKSGNGYYNFTVDRPLDTLSYYVRLQNQTTAGLHNTTVGIYGMSNSTHHIYPEDFEETDTAGQRLIHDFNTEFVRPIR